MVKHSSESTQAVPALRFSHVVKAFGQSVVLNDVSFDVMPGEIHALLGANGAGKSTLIKILAGVHRLDSGYIEVFGERLNSGHDSNAARDVGVAFVHQDLGLVDDLSVADNIALQLGFDKRWGLVDDRATEARARAALEAVGAEFSPKSLVSSLSRDEQVLCALARALAQEPRVVVLDEVTASLPKPEVERLAASLKRMRRGGAAFIYVTHRLDELTGLVDTATVLRNGVEVVTAPMSEITPDALVRHIVGTDTVIARHSLPAAPVTASDAEKYFVVENLTSSDLVEPISFEVRSGEVLGVCGLVGSGTRELAQALAGAQKPTGGSAWLQGAPLPIGRPEALTRRGFTVVPGDRQREGVITGLGLRENMLPTRREFGGWSRAGFRNARRETRAVMAASETFGVVPRNDPDRVIAEFSGGNQQKIIFARALGDLPAVAVLEDPTAGVDIGSREVLYELMHNAARSGTAIIMISTDFEEVAAQSHRVLVLSHGKIVGEFVNDGALSADVLAEASYAVAT